MVYYLGHITNFEFNHVLAKCMCFADCDNVLPKIFK